MDNKKVDIKALLEQNNLQINNRQVETDPEKIMGIEEHVDTAQVENANDNMGQILKEEEI